jgi:hypothetical protein
VFVKLARWLARAVWFASLIIALAIVSAQALFWLKTGTWPKWTALSGFSAINLTPFILSWHELQRAWTFFLGLPLSIAMILTGAVLGNLIWQPVKAIRRVIRAAV